VQALFAARRVLTNAVIALRRTLRDSTAYHCGGVKILLPPGHMLPVYRSRHHQYDTFLPVLVRQLGEVGVVVDVGANVGDTLAFMVQENRLLRYVCIEPEEEFFSYLQDNCARLEKHYGSLSVDLMKALVGDGNKVASLRGQDGTKSAVADSGGVRTQPLDVLLPESRHPLVRLIKSDVDGFDYEVIRSAMAIRHCCAPILYFECQFVDQEQRQGFDCLIGDLIEDGYKAWVVFDNFGGLMLETTDLMTLRALLAYVWEQNVGNSSRTIHYYDLLAYTRKDSDCVSAALADYRARRYR
jgi:FkbM family methyltransferase